MHNIKFCRNCRTEFYQKRSEEYCSKECRSEGIERAKSPFPEFDDMDPELSEEPTRHEPGSWEKIEVMRKRLEKGERIHHPEDYTCLTEKQVNCGIREIVVPSELRDLITNVE